MSGEYYDKRITFKANIKAQQRLIISFFLVAYTTTYYLQYSGTLAFSHAFIKSRREE